MNIPINIETLLAGKVVESERIEFKKGWNPTRIMRTVAAFANDFENLGSGYIVVGIEEVDGMPKRPAFGFPPEQYDQVQKEMIGYCNLIRPPYFPRLSLEEIDGVYVLLIWVTAGSNRPYEIPKDVKAKKKEYEYFIRKYSNTVKANAEQKQELISLTAKVPFDDRANTVFEISEINYSLIREHLYEIKSKLYPASTTMSALELAGDMNLTQGAPEHLFPKNVGLLMFSENPKKYFPGAQIDIVEFPEGLGSKQFNEKIFEGPIQKQLKNAIDYIKSTVIKNKVVKHTDRMEADNFANYPLEAIEEALSNAVYHKDYELPNPIEVRILPESIEIISYSGVDPSLKQADFDSGTVRSRRYRNRRIGEFLKELQLTEGRGTGIPTIMKALSENGSNPAIFDTDEPRRSYFFVEIPIHPDFIAASSDQVGDQDKVLIDKDKEAKDQVRNQVGNQVRNQVVDRIVMVLKYCVQPKTKNEILDKIGLSRQSKYFIENIGPAIGAGFLEMTIPDKPTSKSQKYITTEKGRKVLSK
jgi:ATP-dependent DNA helicase RecG